MQLNSRADASHPPLAFAAAAAGIFTIHRNKSVVASGQLMQIMQIVTEKSPRWSQHWIFKLSWTNEKCGQFCCWYPNMLQLSIYFLLLMRFDKIKEDFLWPSAVLSSSWPKGTNAARWADCCDVVSICYVMTSAPTLCVMLWLFLIIDVTTPSHADIYIFYLSIPGILWLACALCRANYECNALCQ